jgi:hypothetical protein
MNTAERQVLKRELATFGIKGDYLEGWQPREDLWRHTPKFNLNGDQTRPAGAIVPNQPTEWDHKLGLAKRGVLQWKPTKDCACKACRERDWDRVVLSDEGHITMLEAVKDTPVVSNGAFDSFQGGSTECPECDFVAPPRIKNPKLSVKTHQRQKHKKKELVTA